MKYKVRVRVPMIKRGLFGRRKVVYVEHTVIVDGRTYRRTIKEQRNQQTDDLMDFIDELEAIDAIFDD